MFGKKKQNQEKLNFKSENYQMKDCYNVDNLVVANLEYVSGDSMACGPMIIQTEQKYIFEILNVAGKARYREIFTGFIVDADESPYFNLPYVVNIETLKDQIPTIKNDVSKYALLLVLDEVNARKEKKPKIGNL